MKRLEIKSGEKFGALTIVSETEDKIRSFICLCDCGITKVVRLGNLRNGHSRSCGCLIGQPDGRGKAKIHGDSRTAEYRAWSSMVSRCTRPHNKWYSRYGGRGISVCDRWLKYENFLEDMGRKPNSNLSIDRIDNNSGYFKQNCRWATSTDQSFNRSSNVTITARGETRPVFEWARVSGLNPNALIVRLKNGWNPEDAIFQPSNKNRKKNQFRSK
jgi:hypothetical protein